LTQDYGPILWSYDDPQSIDLKCQYVIENNLGGVAIWDVTMDLVDGRQELLETVGTKLMSTPTEPRMSITALQNRITIQAGRSAIYTIFVTAGSYVTGPITLTLPSLPLGLDASLSPDSVTPPGTTLLTITHTDELSPGTYSMTVTGVYSPLSLHASVSVYLTVVSPQAYLPLIQRKR
jgi:hypothetical protein